MNINIPKLSKTAFGLAARTVDFDDGESLLSSRAASLNDTDRALLGPVVVVSFIDERAGTDFESPPKAFQRARENRQRDFE